MEGFGVVARALKKVDLGNASVGTDKIEDFLGSISVIAFPYGAIGTQEFGLSGLLGRLSIINVAMNVEYLYLGQLSYIR